VKHIVSYSGGIGSWMTAKRVIEQHGKENVILVFTDTKIEDEDLYRFIDETVKEMDVEYIYLADGRTPWEVFKDKRFIGNSRTAHCSHVLKQDVFRQVVRYFLSTR
jgi:3'-phosphoadenosine 5'-phosphosulfate sulfotransferase (PAPS reductase)/FAD synthetase